MRIVTRNVTRIAAGFTKRYRGVVNAGRAAIAVALLASLAACSGSSTGVVNPPPPPPNTSGPVEIFPGTVSVPVNGKVNFTAFLPSDTGAHFTWSVSGSSNGSIDATGVYTAPTAVPSPATATITATDAAANATGTATINITVVQGVAVSPAGIAVPAGTTQTFMATVGGLAVVPTWQVNGTPGGDGVHGTISAGGVYTAPLTPPPGGSTTVTAVSGANSGTSSVTVVFSGSSLNGPYAFSYTGSDSGGPLAVAGRFVATSGTGALAGLEDYNSLKIHAVAEAQPFTGTFTVNPDGSGSATVTDAAIGGNDTWHFRLTPGTQGGSSPSALLVRFDTAATGSGDMEQQNPAQLTLSAFAGNYAFGLGGFDPSGKALQIAGKFKSDGLGNIPVNFGVEDINDGGATNTSGGADLTLHGTFFLDPMSPGTGRGILQMINTSTQFPGTFNFTFYMVDGTHLKLVENDVNAFLAGSCFSAPNTNGSFAFGILKGNYAFTLSGGTSGGQAAAEGGEFVAGGTGNIVGGELDRNTGGSTALAQVLSASSYSVDPSLGRITLSLSVGTNSVAYAAYTTSSGPVEIISLDSTRSTMGQAFLQSSTGPVAGTFALNLASVTNGSKTFTGQNVLGGIQANSSLGAISGILDVNNAGSLTSGTALTTASAIVAADAVGRGTASLVTSGTTFGVVYYVVSPNTVLLLGSDGSRVQIGSAIAEF